MKMKDRDLIYAIEIQKENVSDALSQVVFEFMARHHGNRAKDYIDSIVLPPSTYKNFELFAREQCRFTSKDDHDGMSFMGIRIVCGALPFITLTFKDFHIAHLEAKRFVSITGGVDA